ncbi:hypothetical protein AURDEDRAFT_184837 [Auricularia subglabra TFB-10046 SS5]|nr:hypothetical protein AURDEDRAFT_184837 [Auricularia subglabra TFB-10046 SS5]
MRMPLDVLYEILRMLHPRDLLALSRTTKAVRRVLLNPSSSGVWKYVISTVEGLPFCPDDIDPPAYASLVFDTHCDFCGKSIAKLRHWELRLRLCGPCSQLNLVKKHQLDLNDDQLDFVETYGPRGSGPRYGDRFYGPQIEDMCEQLEELGDEEYHNRFRSRNEAVAKHASECAAWENDEVIRRATEIQAVRDQRANCVLDRLTDMGFGRECLLFSDEISNIPTVNVARPLTERAWRSIQTGLLRFVVSLRTELDRELHETAVLHRKMVTRQFVEFRCSVLGDINPVLPSLADYAAFPYVRDLLDPALDNDSVSEPILRNAALATFSTSLAAWRDSLAIRLFDSVFPSEADVDDDAKMRKLNLATTFFKCSKSCRSAPLKSMRYPTVLGHACQRGGVCHLGCLKHCTPWTEEGIVPDPIVSNLLANILRACGMDPEVTTHDELLVRDPRVICTSCGTDRGAAMTWYLAVMHALLIHSEEPWFATWARLSPEAEAVAQDIAPPRSVDERTNWLCRLCPLDDDPKLTACKTWEAAKGHAINTHGLDGNSVQRGVQFTGVDETPWTPENEPVPIISIKKAGVSQILIVG